MKPINRLGGEVSGLVLGLLIVVALIWSVTRAKAEVRSLSDGLYEVRGLAVVVARQPTEPHGTVIDVGGHRVRLQYIGGFAPDNECEVLENRTPAKAGGDEETAYRWACGLAAEAVLKGMLTKAGQLRCNVSIPDSWRRSYERIDYEGVCRNAEGADLAWQLVRTGWAEIDRRVSYNPYSTAETAAHDARLGIWSSEVKRSVRGFIEQCGVDAARCRVHRQPESKTSR